MAKHNNIGALGEKIAAKYLKSKGFIILDMNYKNNFGKRLGEIDIIAKKDSFLVFVEVKTRKMLYGRNILPQENINKEKLYKLSRISQLYLKQKRLTDAKYRFDAVTVLYDEIYKKALVKHFENIFI